MLQGRFCWLLVTGLALSCHRKIDEEPPIDATQVCSNYCGTRTSCMNDGFFESEEACRESCTTDPVWRDDKLRECVDPQMAALNCLAQLSCEELEMAQTYPFGEECGELKFAWSGCLAENGGK